MIGDNFSDWLILLKIFQTPKMKYNTISELTRIMGVSISAPNFRKNIAFLIEKQIVSVLKNGNNTELSIDKIKLEKYLRERKTFKIFGEFVIKTSSLLNLGHKIGYPFD